MKISELIRQLEDVESRYGDVYCHIAIGDSESELVYVKLIYDANVQEEGVFLEGNC